MPKLNNYILINVAKEIMSKYRSEEKEELLAKFMLSGQEPFAATIKCFSAVKEVEFHDTYFRAIGPNGFDVTLSYSFGLLRPIVKALESTVISVRVLTRPEDNKGVEMIERMITPRLQEIQLSFYCSSLIPLLPARQWSKLAMRRDSWCFCLNEAFFDSSVADSLIHGMPMYSRVSLAGVWNSITDLEMECSLIDKCGLLQFISNLRTTFPGLQNIHTNFFYDEGLGGLEEELIVDDNDMQINLIEKLQTIRPLIPANLSGKISCSTFWYHTTKKERFLGDLELDIHLATGKKLINITEDLIVEITVM